jgi:hypothetical protein
MIRSLSIVLLAFATFMTLRDETRGETANDTLLQNMIPEISCSTTAVIKNENPTGLFKFSEYQTKICENFQRQFLKANRELVGLPKKPSMDLDKFFERWMKITGSLCKEIVIGEKLIPIDYGCLFGIPSKEQPIARAMYELYLNGNLPEEYSDGSWCSVANLPNEDRKKEMALAKVFGQIRGRDTWKALTAELLKEGFRLEPENGTYYRHLALASNDNDGIPAADDWTALPIPLFRVYYGQEMDGVEAAEPCLISDPNCSGETKIVEHTKSDGICMAWRGFGP